MSTSKDLIILLETYEDSLLTLSRRLDSSLPSFNRALSNAQYVLGCSNTRAEFAVQDALQSAKRSVLRAESSVRTAADTIGEYLRSRV